MAKTDTIQPVARPRETLSETTKVRLSAAKERRDRWEAHYRATVIAALEEGSFAEVSKATGLSTNTLQRWKKEAGR